MQIVTQSEHTIVECMYTINDDGQIFYCKEWLNDRGKVIDSVITSEDGETIQDAEITERIFNLIDNQ